MGSSTLVIFVVLGAASLLLHSSKATEYEVGDTTGWQTPSDTSFYSNWASGKNFTVGDTLKFTFSTSVHDVATVSKSDYDNCNVTGQSNVVTNGPATITLKAGNQYYLCTFSNHCTRGQKLAINVAASSPPSPPSPPGTPPTTPSSSPPPSSPSPPSPPSPPPPPSASSSLVATFASVFMPIAISFMYYF